MDIESFKKIINHIVIIQPCLPHYRVPLFAELTKRLDGKVSVLAGKYSFGNNNWSVKQAPGVNWIEIYNLFIRNHYLIQYIPNWVAYADIVVLSFDFRIISNFFIFLQRKSMKLPIILWGHGFSSRQSSPKLIRHIRKLVVQSADAVILYSEAGKKDFVKLGVPDSKLFVAHNSVDIQAIEKQPGNYPSRRKDILFIGRLVPEKKAAVLLEGFKIAKSRFSSDTHLIIVGDGPERNYLESIASNAGMENLIEFVGEKTSEDDLAQLFARSAICVSPGCAGLSIIHSLAYGVPLLIGDNEPHGPEIEAFMENINGKYFISNDPNDLADRLVELLSRPDQLKEMGLIGQKLIKLNYSIQKMADIFIQAFIYTLR